MLCFCFTYIRLILQSAQQKCSSLNVLCYKYVVMPNSIVNTVPHTASQQVGTVSLVTSDMFRLRVSQFLRSCSHWLCMHKL